MTRRKQNQNFNTKKAARLETGLAFVYSQQYIQLNNKTKQRSHFYLIEPK